MLMRAALGVTVHTGWAACVVVTGSGPAPDVEARERVELLGESERFVFHRAAEMTAGQAERWLADARTRVVEGAARSLGRLSRTLSAARPKGADSNALSAARPKGADSNARSAGCAIVAKPGALLPLGEILASHPRIHAAEGLFYRDALCAAALACGLAVRIVAPRDLDPKDARLAAVGRALGKPWTTDWKLATLAAWGALPKGA
jgi:hypothetical protein